MNVFKVHPYCSMSQNFTVLCSNENNSYVFILSVNRPRVKVFLLSSGWEIYSLRARIYLFWILMYCQHPAQCWQSNLSVFVRRTNEKCKEQYSSAYNAFISMQEDIVSNIEFLE